MRFNIVIPTRERSDTLFWTIKTCLNQNYDNLKIIISDNCSEDNTKEVVLGFNDSRIQYIRTPKKISMSLNWEFGLNAVESGLVTLIGDDDGLLPNVIPQLSEFVKQTQIQTICWHVAAFNWPSISNANELGSLTVPLLNKYKIISSKEILKTVSGNIFNAVYLPSLYWGMTNIHNFHKAKKNNFFFHSFQPDIYSGLAIANTESRYIYSYKPFSISGASHHSSGKAYLNTQLDQTSNQKFFKEDNIPVHPKISIDRSNVLLLAEPYLQASDIYNNIPKLEMKKLINSAIYESVNCGDENKFKSLINTVRIVAEKNNLLNYYNRIIKKVKFNRNANLNNTTTGFNEDSYKVNINCKSLKNMGLNINNIFCASLFCSSLLSNQCPDLITNFKKEIIW